eukprot:TRINITY_DN2722_c0_g1_i2.p1 TRINITY_DN2722_c0_g1~~TRINITY_DN2722_c0_g1_i2.p1  ORF type:complete len:462 (-),score=96.09 TRINITY_DN2722_c0_g1_i2:491-1876(-)
MMSASYKDPLVNPLSLQPSQPPQDEVDVAQLMKDQPASQELVDYYRKRVELFDEERKDLLERIRQTQVAQDEYHRIRYLLFKKDQEIEELQKALRDAHLQLFEERDEILRLNAIIDELQIQEQEDRCRIQELLQLSQPIQEDVTFFRDVRPNKVSIQPFPPRKTEDSGKSRQTQESARSGQAWGPKSPISNISAKQTPQPVRVLRTVYFPDEKNESILRVIESLRRQLEEQKIQHESKLAAFIQDREIAEEEYKSSAFNLRQENIDLLRQLEQCKNWLREANMAYATEKQQSQVKEENHSQEIKIVRELNKELEQKLVDVHTHFHQEVARLETEVKESYHDHGNFIRKQTFEKEEVIQKLKEREKQQEKVHTERVQVLTDRLIGLKERYAKLSTRRTFELEGFSYDITAIRKEMRSLENAIHKLNVQGKRPDPSRRSLTPTRAQQIVESAGKIKVCPPLVT